jgi:hypothetical protein
MRTFCLQWTFHKSTQRHQQDLKLSPSKNLPVLASSLLDNPEGKGKQLGSVCRKTRQGQEFLGQEFLLVM